MANDGTTISAPVALSDLADVFGNDGGDVRLSDYVRGGGLVPETSEGSISYGPWSVYSFQNAVPGPYTYFVVGGTLYWDSFSPIGSDGNGDGVVTTGGYQYEAGPGGTDPQKSVRRRTVTEVAPSPINEDVPSSPPLKLSDFDGAKSE